ncbi:MAG: fumarate reductase (quinol) flavoprotein subunit [Gammaproteobacteria bacterium]|nr:MAG: fumarate reductase (quinol) flavoprotein subunit [Gammaproteobacteria bacterium]
MEIIESDVIIVGAGGGGLRSAIAIAEKHPDLNISLLSKVYPMRSHTVAAEGGAAAVAQAHDTLDNHFDDTVSGGDWLCDQEVVDYFVSHSTDEMIRLENWGCPWSRRPDGTPNVRAFGGMKIERTWFAADKTGFHILHTLFQTSLQFPSINRFDEYFCTELLVEDGECKGVVAIEIKTGIAKMFVANAVILATGGAGRVYQFNTNGGIVTGDGMSMAYRKGVALRDMEFVQYHPTGLPSSGILMTEGCRGEGGLLVNKDGYRYLQDYGLGPAQDKPVKKSMELGPRDRLSQAFWHERQKGRTVKTEYGDVVYLDLRHLGEDYLMERLPLICHLAESFEGVNPVTDPVPVRPAVHYTMGGIRTDIHTATSLPGLYAVGECASSGLHGANRLGSNSLAEFCVFGKVAGEQAAKRAIDKGAFSVSDSLKQQAQDIIADIDKLRRQTGSESIGEIRKALTLTMEDHCGIYREEKLLKQGLAEVEALIERYQHIGLKDTTETFNTELLMAYELGMLLDIAKVMLVSALNRTESRGAHQRLEPDYTERDDVNFLKHTLAYYDNGDVRLDYEPVNITRSQPRKRVYGAELEQQHKEMAEAEGKS